MKTTQRKTIPVPPFIIIGALLILLPIFIFVTYQNVKRQQANATFLLLEKGAALIRSFEAGARAGMRGRMWGTMRLQMLIDETAKQTDIAYIVVTDEQGKILAHSDESKIGSIFGRDRNVSAIARSRHLNWRIIDSSDDKRIFEIFKEFKPIVPGKDHKPPMRMQRFRENNKPGPGASWFKPDKQHRAIFVGLDMKNLDESTNAALVNSIVTGVLLFFAGAAGIVVLFLFQNYRTARTSLSKIKAFSDNLVLNMPIGLVALDTEKKISNVNKTAEEILGIEQSESLDKPVSDLLPFELLELMDEVSEKERIIGRELSCSFEADIEKQLEVSLSSIRDEKEELTGYAFLIKDLSEIYQLRKEVIRSQKMATIGRLAAGVAHEIRNPLSSIKGFATYFKERDNADQRDQRIAGVLINEVERLDRVVGQLLELAKPVKIMAQETDLRMFLEQSTHLISKDATDKKVEISLNLDEPKSPFFIDRDKLNQVLLNLYLNAIDAMENGGTLSLGLAIDSSNQHATITISDSGEGISEQHLPKIFDPYFTTKSQGTGLGLAIVHNILEAHQGSIKAVNNTNTGSTFTITIPNLKPKDDEN